MDQGNLYEQFLAGFWAQAAQPQLKPPLSATSVILWRGRPGRDFEVYWVKRSQLLGVLGGWHAFPGGGLGKGDLAGVVADAFAAGDEDCVPFGDAEWGRSNLPHLRPELFACVARELFEETGLLLMDAESEQNPVTDRNRLNELRQRLAAREATLAAVAEELGARLSARRLEFAGRWITPALAPARFDSRFFLLE